MSKKLIFFFIAIFILTLALGGYFVIQKVRGLTIASNIDMNYHRIYNFPRPLISTDAFNKEHLHHVGELFATDGSIASWCEINYAWWCDYGYPETWCGDGSCNGDEDFIDCPEDCGGGCFTAEIQILMADGKYKPIKEVKEGDWILTKKSESSDKMVLAEVAKTFEHIANSYLVINNKLKVTDIHPIFANNKWKQVGAIKLGDKLLNEKGQEVVVESLKLKRGEIKVYNLEIEGPETYFAGGFYVHNKEPENGFVP